MKKLILGLMLLCGVLGVAKASEQWNYWDTTDFSTVTYIINGNLLLKPLGTTPNTAPILITDTGSINGLTVNANTLYVGGQSVSPSNIWNAIYALQLSTPSALSISEWNQAYTQRNQWDGDPTALNVATAQNSLLLIPDIDIPSESSFKSVQVSTGVILLQVLNQGYQIAALQSSTGTLQSEINSLGVSTGSLNTSLSNEISTRSGAVTNLQNQIYLIAGDTAAINLSIYALSSTVALSTAALQGQINNLAVSTGSLALSINSTNSNLNSFISAVNISTSSLNSKINNLELSTGSIQSELNAEISSVSSSTGSLQSQINNHTNEINNISSNLSESTTAINSALYNLQISTFAMANIKVSTGQVTGLWNPALLQAGVIPNDVLVTTGSIFASGTASASTFLRGDGFWAQAGEIGGIQLTDSPTIAGLWTFTNNNLNLNQIIYNAQDGFFYQQWSGETNGATNDYTDLTINRGILSVVNHDTYGRDNSNDIGPCLRFLSTAYNATPYCNFNFTQSAIFFDDLGSDVVTHDQAIVAESSANSNFQTNPYWGLHFYTQGVDRAYFDMSGNFSLLSSNGGIYSNNLYAFNASAITANTLFNASAGFECGGVSISPGSGGITTTGAVGVATPSPAYTLDVNGQARATSFVGPDNSKTNSFNEINISTQTANAAFTPAMQLSSEGVVNIAASSTIDIVTGGSFINSATITPLGSSTALTSVYVSNIYTSSFTVTNSDGLNAYNFTWQALVNP